MGITHSEVSRHPSWQRQSKRPSAVPMPIGHSGRAGLILAAAIAIALMAALALR